MKYLTLWALLCILFGCGGTSQEEPPKKPSKIIFGYLQYEQLPEYQIPWDQLTHLSIAFGRATEEGGLAAYFFVPLSPIAGIIAFQQ